MTRVVALDFETYYSTKEAYSVAGTLPELYCADERFDAYLLSAYDGEKVWVGHPKDYPWDSLQDCVVIHHNKRFDDAVWRRLVELGIARKPALRGHYCTASMATFLCGARSLAQASAVLLKKRVAKQVRTDADGKRWPQDFSPEERDAMLKYAGVDAKLCHELWIKCSDKWPEEERELANITIEQGRLGVHVDRDLLEQYLPALFTARNRLESMIPWLRECAGEDDECFLKPTSRKALVLECRKAGIEPPPVKAHDPEAFAEWEEQHAKNYPWIRAVSAWRSVNRERKTLETVRSRLRPDGTMPFSLKYFGAHTGRWSGDAGINMQNPRKVPLLLDKAFTPLLDPEAIKSAVKHKEKTGEWPPDTVGMAIDIRALWTARPGNKLAILDLAQIEPRVLAWVVKDEAMLSELRAGKSVYEAHARATMGWTGSDLKSEDPKLYHFAKCRVLGLSYGAGWRRFISLAQQMVGLDITADDPEFEEVYDPAVGGMVRIPGYGATSRKIVNEYRASNPRIVAFWNGLDRALKSSLGKDLELALPSGRTLVYENIRQQSVFTEQNKEIVAKRAIVGTVRGRDVQLFGGKLCENVIQAIARDVFGAGVLRAHRRGFPVLFTVHDEAVMEVPASVKVEEILPCFTDPIPWAAGLPLAASIKEAERYEK